jgi:hypothetical protein
MQAVQFDPHKVNEALPVRLGKLFRRPGRNERLRVNETLPDDRCHHL